MLTDNLGPIGEASPTLGGARGTGDPVSSNLVARPFLSWVGSKRKVLSQITPHLPRDFGTYIEPFLGAGSLFLELRPKEAILSDVCVPLIETWQAVAKDANAVYEEAVRRPLDKDSYYEARSSRGGSEFERAGLFIYLNKGAFNGLFRVNKSGQFNVPWGRPKGSFVCDRSNLERVGALLSNGGVEVSCQDFDAAVVRARRGDLVYLDPPYVTQHNHNGFAEYNERIFSWADQERLATAAKLAADRGAHVVVSNADHPDIVALYAGFAVHRLERASTLAANSAKRGVVTEVLMIGGDSRGS